MRTILLFFSLLLLLLFTAGRLSAQELRYAFKNYTPSDGLPSSEVHKVLKDSKHYMWFATDHGVCRYNGYKFETFNLPDNSILGLYEDYQNRVWTISFTGQLFYFENGEFIEYRWNAKVISLVSPGVISAIHLDSSGALYIAATGPHAYKIAKDGNVTDLMVIENKVEFVSFATTGNNFFTHITSYPGKFTVAGNLPILNTNLVFFWDKKKMQLSIPYFLPPERFKTERLSDDEISFHSRDMLIRLKLNGQYSITRTGYIIYAIEEIDDVYYFATEKGLRVENKEGEMLAEYFTDIQIVSIAKDYEGGLWLTSLTRGVFYLNSSKIRHLSTKRQIVDKEFSVLYVLHDESILAGTNKGEIVRFKPFQYWHDIKSFIRPVYSFYQDSTRRVFTVGPFIDSLY